MKTIFVMNGDVKTVIFLYKKYNKIPIFFFFYFFPILYAICKKTFRFGNIHLNYFVMCYVIKVKYILHKTAWIGKIKYLVN